MPYVVRSSHLGLPVYTHQVEVHKYAAANASDEPYDTAEANKPWETDFDLVWAVIEPILSSAEGGAGTQGQNQFRLLCDPCGIDHQDFIVDPLGGWIYQVIWVARIGDPQRGIAGFPDGYGHIEGELQRVEGLV